MLHYYAVKSLAEYLLFRPGLGHGGLIKEIENSPRVKDWVNLGGQIVPAFRLDELRRRIREGEVSSWEAIHGAYDEMAAAYPLDRARHAWEVYRYLKAGGEDGTGADRMAHPLEDTAVFKEELENLIKTRRWISAQVYTSRAKDFNDPFRGITYRNREEMRKVAGSAEDNPFVKTVRENEKQFIESIQNLLKGLY
jgi:hypothetical protein